MADLRGSEFGLTPEGQALVVGTLPEFEAINAEIETLLGVQNRAQLLGVLEHVVQSLGLPGEDELGTD